MSVCNKDCFNCQSPDCVYDGRRQSNKKYASAYYLANAERIRAKNAAYRARNMDDPQIQAGAARLREWRIGKGYSQAALARAVGLAASTICLAEVGKMPIPKAVREMMGGMA